MLSEERVREIVKKILEEYGVETNRYDNVTLLSPGELALALTARTKQGVSRLKSEGFKPHEQFASFGMDHEATASKLGRYIRENDDAEVLKMLAKGSRQEAERFYKILGKLLAHRGTLEKEV